MDLMRIIPLFETARGTALGFTLRFSMLSLHGVDALSLLASSEHDM
jgi:hypothetical protein